MADNKAKIVLDGKEIELPVKTGTIGPDVVDIGALYKNTGAFTYDPGFTSTGACESKITYIDGDKGILLHRGYAIDELADLGVLDDVSGTSNDPLSKELEQLTASQNVEDELAALKSGTSSGDRKSLPGG